MSSLFKREKIDVTNKYGLEYITKSILGLPPEDKYINEEFIKNKQADRPEMILSEYKI